MCGEWTHPLVRWLQCVWLSIPMATCPFPCPHRPGLCLQIEDVPQEIQTKGGPVSVSREIAGAFNLEGVREVWVRRVERVEVGLDLVELRIKVC